MPSDGGGPLVVADRVGEAVAGEQRADLVGGEPGLDAEPLERGRVAHQVALALVGRIAAP